MRVMEGVSLIAFPRVSLSEIWLLAALCFPIIWAPGVMAQEGFVSLDCGATGATYSDSHKIEWSPDSGFGLSEVSNATSVKVPIFDAPMQFSTIRYFPGDQTKYCYEFNKIDHDIRQGSAYLIRASFWAGDSVPFHTQVSQQINFKLLINSDEWDNVSVALPQQTPAVVKEMYMVANTPSIAVCLAGRGIGMDTPFISSLVLRPLNPDMIPVLLMKNVSRAMFDPHRINYGAPSPNYTVSYPSDQFDRVWDPDTRRPSISTTHDVNTYYSEHPPVLVMQTALQDEEYINIEISVPASGHAYFYAVYLAEIDENVTGAGQRVFKLEVHDDQGVLRSFVEKIDLYMAGGLTRYQARELYSPDPIFSGDGRHLNFSFQRLPNSTYGPLVCGLELLRLSDNEMSLSTHDDDVVALKQVATTFSSLNSWSGDPCLPYAYNWLKCTNDGRPRISNLYLSNKDLHGEIPAAINDLTALVEVSLSQNKLSGSIPNLTGLQQLKVLDLSDNNLSGSIPEFLAQLPSITTLLLQNNNLSGDVPSALLEKAAGSILNLSFAGNPLLCISNNVGPYCSQGQRSLSKNHTPVVVALAVIGAVVALIALGGVLFRILRRKSSLSNGRAELGGEEDNYESIVSHANIVARASRACCFTYEDIKTITSNFVTKLGEGGFGHVYHGVLLDGVNAAVKVLSKDSRQGVDEFLNEVALLSRIHHKNLVGLLGYCTERTLILVYEFMPNGSLYQVLHGKGVKRLAWMDRLRIAVASAEGLDYLHKGCSPRIVHRDVKSSNILLNDKMEGKISDFGISRSKSCDTSGGDTEMFTVVQGSFGYLDPEYAVTHIATHKIDVYAFGILLLEIITGRRPLIYQKTPASGEQLHILEWVRPLVERGDINELVDAAIANDYNLSSMWKVIDVAMMCVEHDSNGRPDMTEVSSDLNLALSMELRKQDTTSFDNPPRHPNYNMDVRAR